MTKILINGINGKMGTEVAKLIKCNSKLHLLGGLDRHIIHNLPYTVFHDVNDVLEKPNVIIDFSVPQATISLLPFAIENKIPLVIATTGFNEKEQKQILQACSYIAIFQSANMSYEITLMSRIASHLSQELQNADIEIVETHHHGKKDAPSGTALLLADSINKANNWDYHYELNRCQKNEKREKKEIGFSSIRGGNIVGQHQVLFFSENETIEIKHTAYSRAIFAEGALKAAEFIVKQEAGYYTMSDLT